ncbi:MAG TPA: (Fe-S)-binding protein [Blastocatellia bacterium]|nr:(Fe-S)-binding protein [Blastocatellia bacterium]
MNVSLFVTCLVDQFFPQVGESTVHLLQRLGCNVDFPADQTCCGQPAFNSGFCSDAKPLAKHFLRVFENSEYIVSPSGSCVSMVKVFYDGLLKDEPETSERIRKVAARTYELTDFIANVLRIEDVGASFTGRVALHQSCHLLRELNLRTEPRRLLEKVKGIELVDLERSESCCGFGGLFSVKYPHISGSILEDKLDTVKRSGAQFVVATDMGCLMHMGGGLNRQHSRVRTMHIAEILSSEP